MGDAWLGARLLQSSRESSLADNCFRGGNYRASVTHFEYAVDADPSNAPAAAGLARALGKLDRRSEAEAVLRRAAVHTKGLPSSALIRSVATELSIDLGSQVEEHPADDSYTTVSPPMAPDTGE
jgi:Flp pilus assembly protein TadD